MGPLPDSWLAACMADLTPDLQVRLIMRVDSLELPLSAIPLCQLLPCHFGPPRPTLSINLYVKGCLDCTTGAFHMSIPSKSSLQNEVQILNANPTSSSLYHRHTKYVGVYSFCFPSQGQSFCVKVYKTSYFEDPLMDFIHIWHDGRYRSKVFISTIPTLGSRSRT